MQPQTQITKPVRVADLPTMVIETLNADGTKAIEGTDFRMRHSRQLLLVVPPQDPNTNRRLPE